MIRTFFMLLIAACIGGHAVRASDAINAPANGASASVSQPHVTAELIPEATTVQLGQPFDIALHLHSDPGWHTYWINPGDAGLATTITWTLPSGFTAGPIRWPTPEKHDMGGLMTYGYAGDVYLLTTITPPAAVAAWPKHLDIKANAQWLVCKEECIPGHADLTVTLDSGLLNLRLPQENKELFDQARERLPVAATGWSTSAGYNNDHLSIWFQYGGFAHVPGKVRFFPEEPNVLSNLDADNSSPEDAGKPLGDGRTNAFRINIKLQQNGDKPDKLSGVLVSDVPLIGDAKAVYISEFKVAAAVPSGGAVAPQKPGPSQGTVTATPATNADASPPPQTAPPLLIAVLGAAFLGGLILNLMPCVLPVLSLKVFSLMKHAGENPKAAWLQGVAFTAGVVISFWVLAGLLLTLRSAGNHLGWGFQMQSPGFVLALIFLFFLLALNLFGVFELGASLVGLDAKATNHLGGLASSFGNGALATLAATPCTAPFMGSALGFAAQQPAFISLLIFTFLALGMAAPYLLLTIFPGALRFVPKPGAWMEAFKQFMGFLLMATVIFLVYVFGALVGGEQVPCLLMALLLAGVAAWIYGRWSTPTHGAAVRATAFVLALGFLGYAINWGVMLARATPPEDPGGQASTALNGEGWQPWTPAAVDQALAQNRPVFVDFTAAWCLSCKVNEAVALDTNAIHHAFAQKNVALFRADWTHADPEISKTLQRFHRDGVPLYLVYSPKNKDAPQVLPEVLTPGIVLEALKDL
jgi:thiol:disulfide interchange protein/DsbC/DsbD-like thiol-disulfide interchange protein